jgi:hypothetical protein
MHRTHNGSGRFTRSSRTLKTVIESLELNEFLLLEGGLELRFAPYAIFRVPRAPSPRPPYRDCLAPTPRPATFVEGPAAPPQLWRSQLAKAAPALCLGNSSCKAALTETPVRSGRFPGVRTAQSSADDWSASASISASAKSIAVFAA